MTSLDLRAADEEDGIRATDIEQSGGRRAGQPAGDRVARRLKFAVLTAAVSWFLAYNLTLVKSIGPYYDELIQAVPAARFIHPSIAGPGPFVDAPTIHLGSHSLPLMTMTYMGSMKQLYLAVPIALFGFHLTLIRVISILIATLALVVIYLWTRRLFGQPSWVPVLAVVFLALDPSLGFYSRVDTAPTVMMLLCGALCAWAGVTWALGGRDRLLPAAAFFAGVGVWDKANFLWIGVALVGAALIFGRRTLLRRLRPALVFVTVLAGAVGSLPFLLYNFDTWPPPTFAATSANSDVAAGLVNRLRQRFEMLDSLLVGGPPAGTTGASVHHYRVWVLGGAALLCVLIVGFIRRVPGDRALRAVAFVGIAVVGTATLTQGGFAGHHLILVYPMPHVALAGTLEIIGRRLSFVRLRSMSRRVARAIPLTPLVAVLPVAGLGLWNQVTLASAFHRTGGIGVWSDQSTRLAIDLIGTNSPLIVTVDWGIANNLVIGSNGSLPVKEAAWQYLTLDGARAGVLELLSSPGSLAVLHAPTTTAFLNSRTNFFAAVSEAVANASLVETMTDRSGTPLFEVYRLTK